MRDAPVGFDERLEPVHRDRRTPLGEHALHQAQMDRTDHLDPGFGQLEERAVAQVDPVDRIGAIGREAQLDEHREQILDATAVAAAGRGHDPTPAPRRLPAPLDPRPRPESRPAPGLGRTATEIIWRKPRSYADIDQDPVAARTVDRIVAGHGSVRVADAAETDLPDGSADVVIGEAMLTMQGEKAKDAIVAEAVRLLRPGGRYAIHELALTPDDLPIRSVRKVKPGEKFHTA